MAREEINDEMMADVNGGLSRGEIIDGAKKLAKSYVEKQIVNKLPLGVLANVELDTVKDAAEKILKKDDKKD